MAGGVRLVATDIDGTLLTSDGSVSPRVAKAVGLLQEAGTVLVLVSARSWRGVARVAEPAGLGGLAICSNGAVVYDLDAQVFVAAHTIQADVVRRFTERCRRLLADAGFGWETSEHAFRDRAYASMAPPVPPRLLSVIRAAERVDDGHAVTKLLVRHPFLPPDELLATVAPAVGEELTATISGGPFVEITRSGVTKAHALEVLCADLGIAPADVLAVGDQPNDLPMLRWAGRAVAMGNSHPSLLREVPEVTATNDEDGLALVIESVLRGTR